MLKEIQNSEELLYDSKEYVIVPELSVTSSIEDQYNVGYITESGHEVAYGNLVTPVANSLNLLCETIELENRTANIKLVFTLKDFLERFDSIIIDGVVFKKEEPWKIYYKSEIYLKE